MKLLKYIVLVFLLSQVFAVGNLFPRSSIKNDWAVNGGSPCATTFFMEMFDKSRYTVEEHTVTTFDGYILKLFHVTLTATELAKLPESQQKNAKRVVHLQHGIIDSSDGFFYNGQNSVGFYLVNKGYDIWTGNNRGNKYSLSHINPDISAKDFFNFSFDEMGLYDVPAFYEYELKYTQAEKITYIAHSQGASQLFAALADPTTSDYITSKTEKFIAMAPVVFMNHTETELQEVVAQIRGLLIAGFDLFGAYNIVPSFCVESPGWTQLLQYACDNQQLLCDWMIPGVTTNPKMDTIYDDMTRLLTHYPSGASANTILKFAQLVAWNKKNQFPRFDYGFFGNLYHYNTSEVPLWDITKIKADITLIGGLNDKLGTFQDINNLSALLPVDKTQTYFIEDWDHITFMFARDPSRLFEIFDKEI